MGGRAQTKQKSLWSRLLGLLNPEQLRPEQSDPLADSSAPGTVDCETYIKLGNELKEQGKLDEAVSSYGRALELEPESALAHYKLGNALMELKRLEEAEASFRRALKFKPDYAEAHNNLGNVLKDLGCVDEAMACYQRALERKPGLIQAHVNLGNVLKDRGRSGEAVVSYKLALAINPGFALAHNNLGNAMQECGRLEEALACYRRALEVDPLFVEAHTNLGNVLCDLRQVEEGLACYQRAIEIAPDFFDAHSNLLFVCNYQSGLQSETPLAHAKAFGEMASRRARLYTGWNNLPDPDRCLRIGWVSGDLGDHSVGHFVEGVFAALATRAAGRLELYVYPSFVRSGPVADRIRASCKAWRSAVGLSDEQLAEKIREDGIDILIDLSGHTAHNRLPMFAWKPAPVQLTWLGYVGTTGLEAMDYLIADSWVLPEAEEAGFVEKIIRLPDSYVCLAPPAEDVQVSALPAISNGFVTFGSFNNLAKVNDEVISVWARILASVPGSQLFLKAKQLSDDAVKQKVAESFAKYGIDPQRLRLEGSFPERDQHLAAYNRVDIALDTFPYPGVTTSAESLWMGVPVLTLEGERFISRQGLGLMMNAGLPDWIAKDKDDYVARAVSHAADMQKLAALRDGLRQQVLASPVFDAQRFAGNFEVALREMWIEWCRRQSGG